PRFINSFYRVSNLHLQFAAKINRLNLGIIKRVFPKQDATAVSLKRPRPDGQPGRMPNTARAVATSVALLIELKAQVL
ncbi:MAG: hypothetical protein LUE22_02890, partial [Oscillospiraceae bacterium]|nr:hypothetical protein [Oscillospiraceae bacterium]